MNLQHSEHLARTDRLYPSVILHGGDETLRQEAAVRLGRILQCQHEAGDRPCGKDEPPCRHCRRIVWPDKQQDTFHPDFQVLERDLKTSTSVDAVKRFLQGSHVSPFEARGQVFVIANAETLSGEAANALLKALEEPAETAPRHFLLLAPSQFDLLPTLRSRSLAIFLGGTSSVDEAEEAAELVDDLTTCLRGYVDTHAAIYPLAVAGILGRASGWSDPRAGRPWTVAARALLHSCDQLQPAPALRRRLLALAENLLAAPELRLRGIPADRILEGLTVRHLSAPDGAAPRRPMPAG